MTLTLERLKQIEGGASMRVGDYDTIVALARRMLEVQALVDAEPQSAEAVASLQAMHERASGGAVSWARLEDGGHAAILEYLRGTIEMGGDDYYLVLGSHDDGRPADICHTGNGPRSRANAEWIAACFGKVPALLAAILRDRERHAAREAALREALGVAKAVADQHRMFMTEEAEQIDAALAGAPPAQAITNAHQEEKPAPVESICAPCKATQDGRETSPHFGRPCRCAKPHRENIIGGCVVCERDWPCPIERAKRAASDKPANRNPEQP